MALRLVDDDLDISLNLPLDFATREALGIQLQRCVTPQSRHVFEVRLMERIAELVDSDIKPPTAKQLIYAIAIARFLDVSVPGEALRFRGAMFDFLQRFAPLYQERIQRSRSEEE
ncbi:hypothetical protein KK141_17330 [Dyella sp. LX-66]|uniref:hypothetical protein n=1 Tax=unclassified Dyella TaxID=2634549 RepID=UPI001BE08BA5|nr:MULTISPECIES: hypothetical protein [unclassified Dyella]MBT2117797.1 hypothetical protein [Dyella sp. LX-1]MBT2141312.1 hypothetical protein [Dyella sp. LX-66]